MRLFMPAAWANAITRWTRAGLVAAAPPATALGACTLPTAASLASPTLPTSTSKVLVFHITTPFYLGRVRITKTLQPITSKNNLLGGELLDAFLDCLELCFQAVSLGL